MFITLFTYLFVRNKIGYIRCIDIILLLVIIYTISMMILVSKMSSATLNYKYINFCISFGGLDHLGINISELEYSLC